MDEQFEIRLVDAKAKYLEARKAEMAFMQAQGEYQEALKTLFGQVGVKLDQQGNFVILDLIDKLRPSKAPILTS